MWPSRCATRSWPAPSPCPRGLGKELTVTVSVGVVVGQGRGDALSLEPDVLLASADRALLNAKSSGRNRIVMASHIAMA
ncbi:hypothetical protein ACFSS8_06790 [Paracoccus kondratievae]